MNKSEEKQIVLKILEMAIPSLSPDGSERLETALRELVKNRHIPLNKDKYLEELPDKKKRICCKMDCGKEAEYRINTDKPYDDVDSCLEHIPELMTDADRHYIDKIETEE